MTPPFSLRTRVLLLLAITFAVSTAALLGTARLFLKSDTVEFAGQPPHVDIKRLSKALRVETNGHIAFDLPANERRLYDARIGGAQYRIADDGEHTLYSSRGADIVVPRGDQQHPTATLIRSPDRKHLYLSENRRIRVGDRYVWIAVAKTAHRFDDYADKILSHYLMTLLWTALPILGLTLLASLYIVDRALRPVIAAARHAETIDMQRLDVRLPTAGLPREILPLIRDINLALDRVECGYRIQREFSADVAHELRTPLSVLRMRLDDLSDGATARRLQADIDAMSRVVTQMLDFAELENREPDPREIADLRQIGHDVVAAHASIALARAKEIAFVAPKTAVPVRANPAILQQAVRNLVENAIKHTPAGTEVVVQIIPDGRVQVQDRGTGVKKEDREKIFRRFWRADRTATKGAGLGLAIAAKAVEMHGGTITVADRNGGGAIFEIDLTGARCPAVAAQ